MLQTTAPRLDPGEQHYWIAGPRARQGQAGCSIAPPPSDRQTNAGPNQHWPKPTLALTMEWQSTAAQCLPRRRNPSERFPYTCGSPTTPIRAGVSYMSG